MGNGRAECVAAAAQFLHVALEGATSLKRKAKGTGYSLRLWLQLQIYRTFFFKVAKEKRRDENVMKILSCCGIKTSNYIDIKNEVPVTHPGKEREKCQGVLPPASHHMTLLGNRFILLN